MLVVFVNLVLFVLCGFKVNGFSFFSREFVFVGFISDGFGFVEFSVISKWGRD